MSFIICTILVWTIGFDPDNSCRHHGMLKTPQTAGLGGRDVLRWNTVFVQALAEHKRART
jgi:hypothetical protein